MATRNIRHGAEKNASYCLCERLRLAGVAGERLLAESAAILAGNFTRPTDD
jgi:hypothetical protein